MVAPRGFSLNANTRPEAAAAAVAFVRHMTSAAAQQRIVDRLREIPVLRSVYDESAATADASFRTSLSQFEEGRLMPVNTELRAVWDAMRSPYQSLLGGNARPEDAATQMQQDAERRIALMHRDIEPGRGQVILQVIGLALLAAWLVWQRKNFGAFAAELRRNRMAYFYVLPAMIAIFAVVVFPFGYNVVLSLSNMSLVRFKDWRVVGLQNYRDVLADPVFWRVLVKTIVWTVANVSLHVILGVVLALALNGPIYGAAIYRSVLIIPWAVPAYITALSWRGMFDFEYGAINLLLECVAQFGPFNELLRLIHLSPPVNWLGEPIRAFEACIVTNVWLGFPFMMVIALGGMQGIPQELYESARIDGAGRWRQFRHITLPLLLPVLLPAITLGAIWTFNNLNIIWLVSNGGEPQDKTHILVSYVYRSVFNLYRYGYGAALSMIIFAILLVFAALFLRSGRATENVYG
jgi:arabinogalactan oligomer/maltooligosaccharide transport system permease protein